MTEAEERQHIRTYLEKKAEWSVWNDTYVSIFQSMGPPIKKRIPNFGNPEAVAAYYTKKGSPYTGDPVWGAGDHYLHPNRFYMALENGTWRSNYIDCDDIAGFAHIACQMIPGVRSKVVTLFDRYIKGSHVICVGTDAYGRTFAIDTNGFRWLPDLDEATLCRVWRALYLNPAIGQDFDYKYAIDTPYPFSNVA